MCLLNDRHPLFEMKTEAMMVHAPIPLHLRGERKIIWLISCSLALREQSEFTVSTNICKKAVTSLVKQLSYRRSPTQFSLKFVILLVINTWSKSSSGEGDIFILNYCPWMALRKILLDDGIHLENKDKINLSEQQVYILGNPGMLGRRKFLYHSEFF